MVFTKYGKTECDVTDLKIMERLLIYNNWKIWAVQAIELI